MPHSQRVFLSHLTLLGIISLAVACGCNSSKKSKSDENKKENDSKSVQLIPDSYESLGDSVAFKEIESAAISSNSPMRFEIVKDSGLDFVNIFDRNNIQRLIESGAGLAIGDYDSDGNADVYMLSTDGPNRLYRGLGNFKFDDVTEAAGVNGSVNGEDVWGAGASFADIDNDGDLDLFVCNMASRNLLYMNNGDGTFSEESKSRGVDYFGASKIGSFCDYDRDGDLDLFLLTNQDEEPTKARVITLSDGTKRPHPDDADKIDFIQGRLISLGEKDILYQNDGKGNFVDMSEASGIHGRDMGLSATWFDVDNDDWPDLYVANDFKGPDQLFRNNGDGTFKNIIGDVTNHTPWFSMGSCAGDLNNDGMDDLMVADMSGANHYKQKVNMGEMSASSWFLNWGHPRQYMRNALYVNTGADQFLETAFQSNLDSTDWSWAVRFVDFDNDGYQDVFVTNGHARIDTNSDVANQLKVKKEQSMEEFIAFKQKLPPINEKNLAFRNLGNLNFEQISDEWNLALDGVSHGVAMADFDHDGDLDMVVNNLNETATLYKNMSSGNRMLIELRGTESNFYGYGARVEIWCGDDYQMRRLHPVSGYLSSDEPVLHFGLGKATTADRMVITWPNGKQQEIKDLPGNRIYRIVERNTLPAKAKSKDAALFVESSKSLGINHKRIEDEFDDYAREPLLPYQLSRLGSGNSWGDVNGDGYPDLFVGAPYLDVAKLFLNIDGKSFELRKGPWEQDVLSEDMGALFFDSDGDGDQDLYVARGSNEFPVGHKAYRDSLYINNGAGNFELAKEGTLPNLLDSSSSVSACDFDRDGDLDLFVGSRSIPGRYPEVPTSRLLRNDGGTFTDATNECSEGLALAGLVTSAIWADYDGDGWTDLIVALEWNALAFYRNENGVLKNESEQLGLSSVKGWWHGLACGDFDNDGDLDFVATNQGVNTKYHCDKEHPHRIYYSDFDNNGTLDLVEAEFENGTEFPVRGRSCSSRCMPFIAEKFDTYHEFALAPLADIYNEEISERPFVEVNELRSMIIWNDSEAGFRFQPLPWLAQVSPGYGVETGDFDGDGCLDIMLAQNFFGSQPETGYMDGGVSLMLKGNGKGDFESVWPNKSGIVVPEDATALTAADFDKDGKVDIVVSTNNSPLRLFRNTSKSKGQKQLRLVGDPGNIRAIGARIVAHSDKGTQQAMVISAGGSYLGQSFDEAVIPNDTTSISITWPDGSESKHAIAKDDTSSIVIKKPEQ